MRVNVSESEVSAFKSKWPASGLPNCGVTFEYASNGDLIDITFENGTDSAEYDGPALLALSQDYQPSR